MLADIQTK